MAVIKKPHIDKVSDLKNPTELAIRLLDVRNRCGFMNNELLEILGEKLGMKIPPSNFSAWVRGKIPTKYPLDRILSILDDIESEFKLSDAAMTYIEASVVSSAVKEWLKSISPKQLAVATNESVQTIHQWKDGKYSVRTRKWRVIKSRVEPFLEFYKNRTVVK